MKLIAAALPVMVISLLSGLQEQAHTSTSGAPGGYTGSPADGKTCSTNGGCHSGGAMAKTGLISSDIPSYGYVPGTVYNITAHCSSAGSPKFGFEVSPQAVNGTLLGNLIVSNTSSTKITGGKYITHTSGGAMGNGSKTWTFQWKAPVSGKGPVTFYGAFNASNGNSSTTGDSIFTSTLTVAEALNLSVSEPMGKEEALLFPNPCSDHCTVVSQVYGDETVIELFDINGKMALRIPIMDERVQFGVERLLPGIYLYRISSPARMITTGKLAVFRG